MGMKFCPEVERSPCRNSAMFGPRTMRLRVDLTRACSLMIAIVMDLSWLAGNFLLKRTNLPKDLADRKQEKREEKKQLLGAERNAGTAFLFNIVLDIPRASRPTLVSLKACG